jgi:aryl-alcohol dehydrogenase-like predicted oxidoreductase
MVRAANAGSSPILRRRRALGCVEKRPMTVPTIDLGRLTVSMQGLGCMGMSEYYGRRDWHQSVATIHRAIDLGVTFLDTANVYGDGHNEVLVGEAVRGRRGQIQLATKFGIDRTLGPGRWTVRGERDYVIQACESSLMRLGVDAIDLYYLHRPPQTAEIEETVGAMAELVAAGKVRYLGLSEVDGELLRRAYAIHPIAAVQSEYSLWTRDPETVVLAALRELGVGLVPYCPLGRGYLTGRLQPDDLEQSDYRRTSPRLSGEAGVANRAITAAVRRVADKKGVTSAQVALAWVHGQTRRLGIPVVPIPGTKRSQWIEENAGAVELVLDADDLEDLDPLAEQVVGSRY